LFGIKFYLKYLFFNKILISNKSNIYIIMKFKIKTDIIKKGLEVVNCATAVVTTTPILENILIKVNFNNIILSSNNLEMAVEYMITEDIEIKSEWAFCLPSRIFTNYILLVDDDYINIELIKDKSVKITTKNSHINIKWLEAKEFPLIPTIKEDKNLTIKWEILKKSINKTLFSSAEWSIRPELAWLAVTIKWKEITFASTDSLRLSEYKVELENEIDFEFFNILPSKTANQIKNIIDNDKNVKIISANSQIIFISWNIKIYSRLINGNFPDYSTFFPKNFITKVEINRVNILWALKKINLVSRENNYSIRMWISSERWVELETSETKVWEWNITLVWSIEWENSIIWINSIYLLEVLNVIKTTYVSISFETTQSPVFITPVIDSKGKKNNDSFRHIIMPLKI